MFKYINLCQGNPGAINFLLTAFDINEARAEAIFQRMSNSGIAGAQLYMLWNDCCGRDTKLAMRIAQFASIEDIRTHINYDGGRGFPFTAEELASLPK